MSSRKAANKPKIIGKVQVFGGPWSLIKTGVLGNYMAFFNKALKNLPFERVYIDAFAGSGAFRYITNAPKFTLFGVRDESQDIHVGSAQLALGVKPAFDQIFFIEKNRSNVKALQELIAKSGHPAAEVVRGNANEVLQELCDPRKWRRRRGVIFLDPFGMGVEWRTLELIARSKALDVWFLFALGALIRNLPVSASKLDAGKKAAVTRVLGTDKWFNEFYKAPLLPSRTLWGTPAPPIIPRRTAKVNQIESYIGKGLRTIFPHVEAPKRLRGPKNQSLFSLLFAVSNPSSAAINLARRGASYILERPNR